MALQVIDNYIDAAGWRRVRIQNDVTGECALFKFPAALPLADIGRKLGVTRERVRQLESRAIALLRQALYRMDPASNQNLLSMVSASPRRRARKERPLVSAAA